MIRTPYSPFVDTCNHMVISFSPGSAARTASPWPSPLRGEGRRGGQRPYGKGFSTARMKSRIRSVQSQINPTNSLGYILALWDGERQWVFTHQISATHERKLSTVHV